MMKDIKELEAMIQDEIDLLKFQAEEFDADIEEAQRECDAKRFHELWNKRKPYKVTAKQLEKILDDFNK